MDIVRSTAQAPETFILEVTPDHRFILTAPDDRGTIYGIYEISHRFLGVDPLWFWKNIAPAPLTTLDPSPQRIESGPPAFRHRGWFINDEDLLGHWRVPAGERFLEWPKRAATLGNLLDYDGRLLRHYAPIINAGVMEKIFEAALRLRANLIIPASFIDIFNPPEADIIRAAIRRGLLVSQHHVEPLGVSHFAYETWCSKNNYTGAPFSYREAPGIMRACWRAYAQRWNEVAGANLIWQVGLRGRGDRPLWNHDPEAQARAGELITSALADQMDIIRSVDPRPAPPATLTLWLEGAELIKTGRLRAPEGVTYVFADHHLTQEMQDDFATLPREPGRDHGFYYHAAVWNFGPHLVQGPPPEKLVRIVRSVAGKGDTAYAILNVSNLREHVMAATVWTTQTWRPASLDTTNFLAEWASPALAPFHAELLAAIPEIGPGQRLYDSGARTLVEALISLHAYGKPLKEPFHDEGRLPLLMARVSDSADRLATLLSRLRDAEPTVDPRRRDFFRANLLVQTTILHGLYRAIIALAPDKLDVPAALAALDSILATYPLAEQGRWSGWYRGDTKLDVVSLRAHAATLSRAAAPSIINAHPQSEYGPPVPFRKIPGTTGTLALEIAGGRLYALEGTGLSIYDIDDPRHPKKLGHVGGLGNVRQLRVRGKTAFVTARQCGLWAVDVSDEKKPKILSNFDTVEMATGLDVVGDIAFIGNRVYGIQCVDASDPAHMKQISALRTAESQSVYYRDGLLFSGNWGAGEITLVDVSNLHSPKAISRLKLDGYGDGMAMRGSILFASTGQHRKSGPEDDRHGAGHGLNIFDVSDPANPVKLSWITFPRFYFGPCDYWTPRIAGDYCFASDTVNGLFVVDISDLKKPKIAGNLILPKADPENPNIKVPYDQITDPAIPQGDPVSSIAIGNGVLYLSGNYTGIYLIDLPGKTKPEPRDFGAPPKIPTEPFASREEGFHSSGPARSNPTRAVAINGDIAYAANVWEGIKIYRLNERGIEQIGRADINYAADVKRSGDRLYVAEGRDGIGVYRIKQDTALEEIGRLRVLDPDMNFVQFVWAYDGMDVVMASCAHSRVHFVDFKDPANPRIIPDKEEQGPGLLYGNYGTQALVKGRYFGIARQGYGLMVFDLADETAKKIWHDAFPLCSQTGGVTAMGDEFLVMRAGGYAFFNPEHPVATANMKRHLFPGQEALRADVATRSAIGRATLPKSEWEGLPGFDPVTGRVAVVNRMFKNLFIYDFSDKENPMLLKRIRLNNHAHVPTFWKGRVVLPGGYSGLLLER